MRKLLSSQAANRFAVTAHEFDNPRELHTIESNHSVWDHAKWLSQSESLADRFVNLSESAICRIIPPFYATDEMIASVRQEIERRGAHVRMLPREKGQASSVEVPQETASVETIRETVGYVMANLVKSANPTALKTAVEKTMTGAGL